MTRCKQFTRSVIIDYNNFEFRQNVLSSKALTALLFSSLSIISRSVGTPIEIGKFHVDVVELVKNNFSFFFDSIEKYFSLTILKTLRSVCLNIIVFFVSYYFPARIIFIPVKESKNNCYNRYSSCTNSMNIYISLSILPNYMDERSPTDRRNAIELEVKREFTCAYQCFSTFLETFIIFLYIIQMWRKNFKN